MNELSLFDSLFNNSMDDVFGLGYRTAPVPKVDVTETSDAYTLNMELPGRTESDVNTQVNSRFVICVVSAFGIQRVQIF